MCATTAISSKSFTKIIQNTGNCAYVLDQEGANHHNNSSVCHRSDGLVTILTPTPSNRKSRDVNNVRKVHTLKLTKHILFNPTTAFPATETHIGMTEVVCTRSKEFQLSMNFTAPIATLSHTKICALNYHEHVSLHRIIPVLNEFPLRHFTVAPKFYPHPLECR